MRLHVEAFEKGVEVGSATFNKGTKHKLVKVHPDQTLELEIADFRCQVDHAATDFLESFRF